MSLEVLGLFNIGGKNQVTVKSDAGKRGNFAAAIEELQSPDTRRLAIRHAAEKGFTNARVELPTAPYAVDPEGKEVVDPINQTIDHYRSDVPISQGL